MSERLRGALMAQVAFEGVDHGFYPLADSTTSAEAWFLVFAVRADHGGAGLVGNEGFDPAPATAFVTDNVNDIVTVTDTTTVTPPGKTLTSTGSAMSPELEPASGGMLAVGAAMILLVCRRHGARSSDKVQLQPLQLPESIP